MDTNTPAGHKSVYIAAIVAGVVVLVYGFGYRLLAARLDGPVNTTPVSQETMDRLPMEIGAWVGQDTPMDERIIRATDTDAHVSRRYSRQGSFESISLWIASGVRARDLMPHRPEVCYTGAGWTLTRRRVMELPLPGDAVLPCNVMQFSRGMLNTESVMVLYYYLVDGQYSADVSLLRSKAWRGGSPVGYVAQVQVIAPVSTGMTVDTVIKTLSDFATESGPAIVQLFDRHESAPISDLPEEAL